jgi:hypothetical protein
VSCEPDRLERTVEIADNGPDLLKFEIDGQACRGRSPLKQAYRFAAPSDSERTL